jgi:hypothetical protein
MDSGHLASDCRFLDQVSARVSLPGAQKQRLGDKPVAAYCARWGITLLRLPRESSRSRENTTQLTSSGGHLIWTTRWRFRRPDRSIAFEKIVWPVHDNAPLGHFFKALVETAPNDELSTYSPANSAILIVAEGAEGGGYYEVDAALGLLENLFAKTVIEFPVIEIVPKHCLPHWKIVTVLDVKEVKAPNVQPTPEPQPPPKLPSYQEIKKALKLDIIQGVLDSAAAEDVRNAPLPE